MRAKKVLPYAIRQASTSLSQPSIRVPECNRRVPDMSRRKGNLVEKRLIQNSLVLVHAPYGGGHSFSQLLHDTVAENRFRLADRLKLVLCKHDEPAVRQGCNGRRSLVVAYERRFTKKDIHEIIKISKSKVVP